MSRLKIPTREELLRLAGVRSEMCVSIYVDTSPLKLKSEECRIELGNMIKEALMQLAEAGHDKRSLAALQENLESVAQAENFCQEQANSLAVLATPENVQVYRLANDLQNLLVVADRFHLKPLLRALTFSHNAYILALSENRTRLIELFADANAEEVRVPDLPKSAQQALGLKHLTASITTLDDSGQTTRKNRLAQYSRMIDEALKPFLWDCDAPVILAAAQPLEPIFRANSSICLTRESINGSPDDLKDHELVDLARPILDKHYQHELEDVKKRFENQAGINRTATTLEDAARAATYGSISLLMADFEKSVTGVIDDNGVLTYSDEPGSYGIIDEIVRRALESGAKIMAVRQADMIGQSGVAALLRFPLPEHMPAQEDLEAMSASHDGV